MKSLFVALAMYSKLPVPRTDWTRDTMAWALCWFPVVGLAVGALLLVWLWACSALELAAPLRAAGALVIPIAVSGGIHLDGLCDTSDALGSHQTRERKLEILKDSHTGAFAIISCCLYLLVFFGAWCQVEPEGGALYVLCLIPVLSRAWSALCAVTLPNARGSGLLATFTGPMQLKSARTILIALQVVLMVLMVLLDPLAGCAAVFAAALTVCYYASMSRRQFGGITGDLEGFFLQICECAAVLAVGLVQAVGGALI